MTETHLRTIFCFQAGDWHGKPRGIALADDGKVLANVLCSSEGFLAKDLGMGNSTACHPEYDKHLGAGRWQIVWLDEPMKVQSFVEALKRNGACGF